jgi:hypothetical protein
VREIGSRGVVIVALVLAISGCGRSGDRESVQVVADRFFAAFQSGDGEQACAQLSPETRSTLESQEQSECRDSVTELDLQGGAVVRVDVFVTNAVVELSSGESAFLDDGDTGWRLSAVGCSAEASAPADRPHDCELED